MMPPIMVRSQTGGILVKKYWNKKKQKILSTYLWLITINGWLTEPMTEITPSVQQLIFYKLFFLSIFPIRNEFFQTR